MEGREATRRYGIKSNSQEPPTTPHPPAMQTGIQRLNGLPLHIPGCVKSPCRTPAVAVWSRYSGLVGARRAAEEGRAGRERLGAQLPANTTAHSISPRPSDTTSHSPASAQKHTHTPLLHATFCRLPPPLSLQCCALLFALWGAEDVAF